MFWVVGLYHSFSVIVVRDKRGDLVFSLSKRVETNLPLQVEAKAINWAASLAVERGSKNLVVKNDTKACIEALKLSTDIVPWRISITFANTFF